MRENYYVNPIQKTATAGEHRKVDIALLSVSGMCYPNCAAHVRNSLLTLNGVINANVDRAIGIAGVAYNPELVTVEMLLSAVASAGNDGRNVYSARFISKEALP